MLNQPKKARAIPLAVQATGAYEKTVMHLVPKIMALCNPSKHAQNN